MGGLGTDDYPWRQERSNPGPEESGYQSGDFPDPGGGDGGRRVSVRGPPVGKGCEGSFGRMGGKVSGGGGGDGSGVPFETGPRARHIGGLRVNPWGLLAPLSLDHPLRP